MIESREFLYLRHVCSIEFFCGEHVKGENRNFMKNKINSIPCIHSLLSSIKIVLKNASCSEELEIFIKVDIEK